MDDEYEPLDMTKKSRIENELAPELEDVITKVASLRKRQPVQCRERAKVIAENTMRYYSKCQVDMTCDDKNKLILELESLQQSQTSDSLLNSLNSVSERLKQAYSARGELNEALELYKQQAHGPAYEVYTEVKIRSPHLQHNPDFVVIED